MQLIQDQLAVGPIMSPCYTGALNDKERSHEYAGAAADDRSRHRRVERYRCEAVAEALGRAGVLTVV